MFNLQNVILKQTVNSEGLKGEKS